MVTNQENDKKDKSKKSKDGLQKFWVTPNESEMTSYSQNKKYDGSYSFSAKGDFLLQHQGWNVEEGKINLSHSFGYEGTDLLIKDKLLADNFFNKDISKNESGFHFLRLNNSNNILVLLREDREGGKEDGKVLGYTQMLPRGRNSGDEITKYEKELIIKEGDFIEAKTFKNQGLPHQEGRFQVAVSADGDWTLVHSSEIGDTFGTNEKMAKVWSRDGESLEYVERNALPSNWDEDFSEKEEVYIPAKEVEEQLYHTDGINAGGIKGLKERKVEIDGKSYYKLPANKNKLYSDMDGSTSTEKVLVRKADGTYEEKKIFNGHWDSDLEDVLEDFFGKYSDTSTVISGSVSAFEVLKRDGTFSADPNKLSEFLAPAKKDGIVNLQVKLSDLDLVGNENNGDVKFIANDGTTYWIHPGSSRFDGRFEDIIEENVANFKDEYYSFAEGGNSNYVEVLILKEAVLADKTSVKDRRFLDNIVMQDGKEYIRTMVPAQELLHSKGERTWNDQDDDVEILVKSNSGEYDEKRYIDGGYGWTPWAGESTLENAIERAGPEIDKVNIINDIRSGFNANNGVIGAGDAYYFDGKSLEGILTRLWHRQPDDPTLNQFLSQTMLANDYVDELAWNIAEIGGEAVVTLALTLFTPGIPDEAASGAALGKAIQRVRGGYKLYKTLEKGSKFIKLSRVLNAFQRAGLAYNAVGGGMAGYNELKNLIVNRGDYNFDPLAFTQIYTSTGRQAALYTLAFSALSPASVYLSKASGLNNKWVNLLKKAGANTDDLKSLASGVNRVSFRTYAADFALELPTNAISGVVLGAGRAALRGETPDNLKFWQDPFW
ncbi:MAG TPA: hypothetical protein DEQ77_05550, partial [Candidatus Omnitrophica bacterium]|nr:hypothetical protein [Candidatus Omnitrophota bacterium]